MLITKFMMSQAGQQIIIYNTHITQYPKKQRQPDRQIWPVDRICEKMW